jgi:hypothetical protein
VTHLRFTDRRQLSHETVITSDSTKPSWRHCGSWFRIPTAGRSFDLQPLMRGSHMQFRELRELTCGITGGNERSCRCAYNYIRRVSIKNSKQMIDGLLVYESSSWHNQPPVSDFSFNVRVLLLSRVNQVSRPAQTNHCHPTASSRNPNNSHNPF